MDTSAWMFTLLLLLILVWQFWPWFSARRMRGRPAPDFSSLLTPDQRALKGHLVFFSSHHCAACKGMGRELAEVAQSKPFVVILDVNEHPELAHEFGVRATPTLVCVKQGRIDRVRVGTVSMKRVHAFMQGC